MVFDLGGVVCHFDPALRLRAFASACGLSEEAVQARLWDSGFSDAHDEGKYPIAGAYRYVVDTLRLNCSLQECCGLWLTAFTPDEAVLELVREVRHRGLKTALLTNNGPLFKAGLRNFLPSVWDCFDAHFFSADLRITKPHSPVFECVMTSCGTSPAEMAFVDDSFPNIDAAAALGWCTFLFQGNALRLESWLDTLVRPDAPS